jgi:hypothetical protein
MGWKLFGLVSVVHETGADVTRSAAGRLAMEAVLLPSVLLPGRGATWEAVDERRARFRMTVGEETVETLSAPPNPPSANRRRERTRRCSW